MNDIAENVYAIHYTQWNAFLAKLDKVNRKAERNGIAGRFSYGIVGYVTNDEGLVEATQVLVENPTLQIADWEFVATVTFEEAGSILRVVPGKSLQGWDRPDAHNCDHCGVRRNRAKSYVVRNVETGETKQVGSSCLTVFLGFQVNNLWLLEDTYKEFERPEPGMYSGPRTVEAAHTIALALVVSEFGKRFVSRGAAADYDKTATVELVGAALFPTNRREDREWAAQMSHEAAAVDPALVAEVLAVAETLRDSDYADNVKVVAASEFISTSSIALLISLVGVWYRGKAQAAEKAAKVAAKGFIAPVKVRFHNVPVTVTNVKYIDGDFGTTTLITFVTEEGFVGKWFASNPGFEVEIGDHYLLTATVKEHGEWQGDDQTTVTRGKLIAA